MPKDVDLNQAVSGLQTMLSRLIREDITLTCQLAPSPAIVRIDPTQLEQAILNLVLNARDALPAGGRIGSRSAWCTCRRWRCRPISRRTAGDYVRLRVIDNGVGIPPEARAHLFEPFFTTKGVGKGTGLGLASVYGIVRQSNGFITVDSGPGAGSVFTMHFPAVPQTREVAAAPPVAERVHGRRDDPARRGRGLRARDHQRRVAAPGLPCARSGDAARPRARCSAGTPASICC